MFKSFKASHKKEERHTSEKGKKPTFEELEDLFRDEKDDKKLNHRVHTFVIKEEEK